MGEQLPSMDTLISNRRVLVSTFLQQHTPQFVAFTPVDRHDFDVGASI